MQLCRHLLLLSTLLTECALAQVSLPGSDANGALTVCVEDTVSQHDIFTGDSPSGIRMWALRMASEKAGIPVSLTFRPWKRCLRDVSRGETEAIAFVTYAGKNKDLFVFPMKAGEVDTHCAMNSGAIALYRRKGEAQDFKNGKFFPDGVVVGSRLGLVIIEVAMQSKNAALVEATYSDALVFKMLLAKRLRNPFGPKLPMREKANFLVKNWPPNNRSDQCRSIARVAIGATTKHTTLPQ